VRVSKSKKISKVREFVKYCVEEQITFSPTEMQRLYYEKFPIKDKRKIKKPAAFRMAMRRLNISPTRRLELKHEAMISKEIRDIEEYEEVTTYLDQAKYSSAPISRDQIQETLRSLRVLWNWMSEQGFPNPREWNLKNLGQCMEKKIGKTQNGQWKNKNKILRYYGAFNRCFQGRLPKGWSMGLKREAGELKDFLEYDEFASFEAALTDTSKMSLEGWMSLYPCEISMGCRGGSKGNTGIMSLRWEHINFETRRCKIRDKGKKGKPARWWVQVPLDLFPWLHSWEKLMKWHRQQGSPKSGRVYPIRYDDYLAMFHDTRHRAGGRIAEDLETMVPHICRKTHAQWGRRIGITLDNLCGDTTETPCVGRYGVGWDIADVPRKYYLTKEPWEYEEQDQAIEKRLGKLNITVSAPSPIELAAP